MEMKKSRINERKKQTIQKNQQSYNLVLKINKIDSSFSSTSMTEWDKHTQITHIRNKSGDKSYRIKRIIWGGYKQFYTYIGILSWQLYNFGNLEEIESLWKYKI